MGRDEGGRERGREQRRDGGREGWGNGGEHKEERDEESEEVISSSHQNHVCANLFHFLETSIRTTGC